MLPDVTPQTQTQPSQAKQPAKVINEYIDEQGRALLEYDNGMVRTKHGGQIVRPPAPEFRGIKNSEDARRIRLEGIQRTREEIANAIVRQSLESGINYTTTAPQAVAAAAGKLWALALSDRTKPRDRREIWESVSRAAGLLADARRGDNDQDDQAGPRVLDVDALRSVVDEIIRAKDALNGLKSQE